MNCTRCGAETKVAEKRGERRARVCLECKFRFFTLEVAESGLRAPVRPGAAPKPRPAPVAAKPKPPKQPKPPKTTPAQEKARRASVRRAIEDINDRRSAYDEYDFLPDA